MDIHVYEITTQNAASGTWSKNTHNIRGGICRQIYLAATNSNVTFDFKLVDDKNNVVYDTIRREKTAIWQLDDEVCLPMHGTYTMKLYNASSDDAFTGRLILED